LLTRLGHEAIVLGGGEDDVPPPADLLLLEPASTECVEQAWLVRLFRPDIPVICLGALPDDAWFLTLGPISYLTKPFTLDQLDAVIDRALAPSLPA